MSAPNLAAGLSALRHLAPLLRRLNVPRVAAYDPSHRPDGRGVVDRLRLSEGAVNSPRGLRHRLVVAFADVLAAAGERPMVELDVYSARVLVWNHSTADVRRFALHAGPPARPLFGEPLDEIVNGTLPRGGAGVLADWLDDRTGTLSGFTAALRLGVQFDPHWPNCGYADFRYLFASANVALWTARGSVGRFREPEADPFSLAGVGLFDDSGLSREWYYRLDPITRPGECAALAGCLPAEGP